VTEPQAELSCCRELRQRAGGPYRGPGTHRGWHNRHSVLILIRFVPDGRIEAQPAPRRIRIEGTNHSSPARESGKRDLPACVLSARNLTAHTCEDEALERGMPAAWRSSVPMYRPDKRPIGSALLMDI
jgi:hypothetical protein